MTWRIGGCSPELDGQGHVFPVTNAQDGVGDVVIQCSRMINEQRPKAAGGVAVTAAECAWSR